MVLSKSDALQIDATVIIGILILLSITTLTSSVFPQGSEQDCKGESFLPDGWDNPIFLVAWVIGAFSVSAFIEIAIILWVVLKNRDKAEHLHWEISKNANIPENAAPSSLIAMIVGFGWMVITVMIFATDAYFKMISC